MWVSKWEIERSCDIYYADDVCLFDSTKDVQRALGRLARDVVPFGIYFASSKCKVLSQDWAIVIPNVMLVERT